LSLASQCTTEVQILRSAQNGNNVQKVLVIFISGTDANTSEGKPGDDVAPVLGAVGTLLFRGVNNSTANMALPKEFMIILPTLFEH
jgi:hypothetical protein